MPTIRRLSWPLLCLLLAVSAVGCSTATIESEEPLPPVTMHVSSEYLKQRLEDKRAPKPPWRVAVVVVKGGGAVSKLVVRDNVAQETIEKWTNWIGKSAGVKEVEYLPTALAPPDHRLSLETLQFAAVSRQCPLLLIVREQRRLVEYSNPWAILYVTVVGSLFVPGTDVVAENRIEVLLVDAVTGRLHGDALITGRGESYGPLYFVNTWRARALRRANSKAAEDVQARLQSMFKQLGVAADEQPPPGDFGTTP